MAALGFLKRLLSEFSQDKIGTQSAALAYIALFSIGPLLLVTISVAGLAFGEQAAEGNLFSRLSDTVGPDTAQTLQGAVANISNSSHGAIALILGTLGMLLAAAGLSMQMQNTFDVIFKVVPDPKAGLKRTVYVKVKNVILVIGGGLVVVASLAVSALISGLGKKLQESTGVPPLAGEAMNALVSLLLFVGLVYLLYRTLPNVKIPRRIVLRAALAVALLFLAGKIILGVIIGHNATASAYGAAASLISLLLWIYYSGQILFIGAEGIKLAGVNRSVAYAPKKFSLKRHTVSFDSNRHAGKLIEATARGFKKGRRKK